MRILNTSLINQSLDYYLASTKSAFGSTNEETKSTDLDISRAVDRKLNELEEKIIISVFLAVIILGFFGNFLVIWTVLLNKHMRTSNNLFILNLAISDLTLCVFSIPFNVYKTLRHTWIFGEFLCKFAPFFQATNVFVSTMSITAIALDRYVNIVCAMKVRQSNSILNSYGPIAILVFIWMFAFFLSSPLFFFNILQTLSLDLESKDFAILASELLPNTSTSTSSSTNSNTNQVELSFDELKHISINHCIENSPFNQSRLIYSYASLLIQYTLPFLIVGIAYGSIWWKLKSHRDKLKHHKNASKATKRLDQKQPDCNNNLTVKYANAHGGTVSSTNSSQCETLDRKSAAKTLESKRRLKMNILLAFIAIIFAASWLPINLFNILSDSKASMIKASHGFYMVNAVCILSGMSSAVSNPFLYGVLNENFKREYVKLFKQMSNRLLSCLRGYQSQTSSSVKLLNNGNHLINQEIKSKELKTNVLVTYENQKLLNQKPVILVNSETICNDVA